MTDYISVVFSGKNIEFDELEFRGINLPQDLLKKVSTFRYDVSVSELKKNLVEAITTINGLFIAPELDNLDYSVDEIEMGLTIGLDGKISFLSIAEGGISQESSIVIKLKRRQP